MNSILQDLAIGVLFVAVLAFSVYFAMVAVMAMTAPGVLLSAFFNYLERRFPSLKTKRKTRLLIGTLFTVIGLSGFLLAAWWTTEGIKNPWLMGLLVVSPFIAIGIMKRLSTRSPKQNSD